MPSRLLPPARFWTTGAIAVVMAALGGARAEAHNSRAMVMRLSRHSVVHTAQLLEASARLHGLGIFARIRQPGLLAQGDTLVLVLETSQGGTPVMMRGEGVDMHPEVPLRLELRHHGDGMSEVLIPRPPAVLDPMLPASVVAGLGQLVGLVEAALV